MNGTPCRCLVFNEHEGLLSVSFSGRNVGSASRHANAPRNPADAIDLFTCIAEQRDLRLDMALEAGDMQFVHNHTILHERTAYEDLAGAGAQASPFAHVDRGGGSAAAAAWLYRARWRH